MVDGCDAALTEWISALSVCEVPITALEDLCDGSLLSAVLHHFIPSSFPESLTLEAGSGSLCLRRLWNRLDSHLNGRASSLTGAGNGEATPANSVLVRNVAKAAALAAFEGPQKEDAVAAVFTLGQNNQVAIMDLIKLGMAAPTGTASPLPETDPDVPEESVRQLDTENDCPSAGGSSGDQEMEALRAVVHQLRQKCDTETKDKEDWDRLERAAHEQLHDVRQRVVGEEEIAADVGSRLSTAQRNQGGHLQSAKLEVQELQEELRRVAEVADNAPEAEARMQKRIQTEFTECRRLSAQNSALEYQLEHAGTADCSEGEEMKAEMAEYQVQSAMMSQTLRTAEMLEMSERSEAQLLLQELCQLESQLNTGEGEVLRLKRLKQTEEDSASDAMGILKFRESELTQLMLRSHEKDIEDCQASDGLREAALAEKNMARELLDLYKELTCARRMQSRLEAFKKEVFFESSIVSERMDSLEAEMPNADAVARCLRMEAEAEAITKRSVIKRRTLRQSTSSQLRLIKLRFTKEESEIVELRAQLERESEVARAMLESEAEAWSGADASRLRQPSPRPPPIQQQGPSEDEESEDAKRQLLSQLREQIVQKDRLLKSLQSQSAMRHLALQQEARLQMAILHELSLRYQHLFRHYEALDDDSNVSER